MKSVVTTYVAFIRTILMRKTEVPDQCKQLALDGLSHRAMTQVHLSLR